MVGVKAAAADPARLPVNAKCRIGTYAAAIHKTKALLRCHFIVIYAIEYHLSSLNLDTALVTSYTCIN